MRTKPSLHIQEMVEFTGKAWRHMQRPIPEEHPLIIYVNGEEVATLMASPHEPLTLALGFLAGEGWLHHRNEVAVHYVCPGGDCVDIWLTHGISGPIRRVFTSGCAGGQTLALPQEARVRLQTSAVTVAPEALIGWMRALERAAVLYREGRGIHAAGLVLEGRLVHVAEDIGRHNAVDRVRGWALLHEVPTHHGILLTTGRISVEMALKAARMGCPILASRTAATSLAVHWAHQWGLTLVTYLRGGRFRIYTHPHRIQGLPA